MQAENVGTESSVVEASSRRKVKSVQAGGSGIATLLSPGATSPSRNTLSYTGTNGVAKAASHGAAPKTRSIARPPDPEYVECVRVLNEKVADFLSTLNLGLEWIGDAGRKLVAMLDTNPDAFDDILEESTSAWLTREVLSTIEAIGRGHLSPEMLILPIHVFNRLALLPTDEQVRAIQGVEVAVFPRNGKGPHHKTDKPAARLTPAEAQRVIGPNGIRTVDEQIAARRNNGCVLGKYQIVMESGCEPRLERVIKERIPDYQKQRVKLVGGCALVELYI